MAKPRTSAKSGFALPATRVKAANAWREWSNPVSGLTVARAGELATAYTRGDYADLMYLMAAPATGVESRDALLGTLMGRREAALESLDWKIRTVNPDTAGFDAALAADQEAALRATYEKFEGLQDLIRHLAAAPFRGFAAAEILRDWSGLPASFAPVAPWNIARDGLAGDWYYNPEARQGSARALGDALRIRPEDWVIATDPRPIHGVSLLRFVRENLAERDWASFCEIYGIPGGVVIGPPNVPEDKEAVYEAAASGIATGGSGYLPNGSDYKANGYPGANSPFREWMEHLERRLVLRATGGLLAVLAANTGVGGGGQGDAHADAFAKIALADARRLSDLLNRAVDRAVLDHHFPVRPRFAYWSLLPDEQPDTAAIVDHALKLSQAGYAIDVAELSERTGYALSAKPAAPAPVATAAARVEVPNAAPAEAGKPPAPPDTPAAHFLDAVGAQAAPIIDLLEKLPDPESDPQAYAAALADLRERLPELLDPAPVAEALASAMQAAASVELANSAAARHGDVVWSEDDHPRADDGKFAEKSHARIRKALSLARSRRATVHNAFIHPEHGPVSIPFGHDEHPKDEKDWTGEDREKFRKDGTRPVRSGLGVLKMDRKHREATDARIADLIIHGEWKPHPKHPGRMEIAHGGLIGSVTPNNGRKGWLLMTAYDPQLSGRGKK